MIPLAVCFILLFFLYLLSRRLSSSFYQLFFRITTSQKFSILFLACIFLPGTFIHELAHLLIAHLVRVPAGDLSVIPSIEKSGEVRAGRVMIAHSDPFRHTIIGIAPMIVGISIIYVIGIYFFPYPFTMTSFVPATQISQLLTILFLYLLFMISTTMFSSRKDLESLIYSVPGIALIILVLHLLGVRISFDLSLFSSITQKLFQLDTTLGIATVIDICIYLFLRSILWLINR
jgi:hypothetical protein